MSWTRRSWLVTAATATLGACAALPKDTGDQIIDTATGQRLSPDDVARRLRAADIVLLGELHDNPHHHDRRAALLTALGTPAAVVAEHLPRSAAPTLPSGATGDGLRQVLVAGGFDAKGWRWPLHEPLFVAIARAGIPLRGGNLEREEARRLARGHAEALPPDLASWVAAAPLTGMARAALEQDLMQGHCGHLSASRMPGMVAAQQARDAAFAQAVQAEWARMQSRPGQGPVILLAGNGHVRRDYGVPTMLGQRLPQARVLTVGFLEPAPATQHERVPYDIAWTTPAAPREDPCEAFPIPGPARAAST